MILFFVELFIALFVRDRFIRPYFGDVLVVILVYTAVRVVFPEKPKLLPIYVFIFAVLVEVLQYLDFAELIYQTYIINYPIRVVHPDGECDGEMQEVLDKYLIDEDNKPTDPRWDELKKLINN